MPRPYIVTPEWLEELRRWQAADKTHTWVWLAGKVGCDATTLTKMVNNPGEFTSSSLVEDICKWTKLPLPHNYEMVDQAEDARIRAIRELLRNDAKKFAAVEELLGLPAGLPKP